MTSRKQKYYKVLTKDLKAPSNTEFSYENWQTKTFKVEGPLEMCKNGLHLYTSLEYLSAGNFGERVFEAIPVGEYISGKKKICCRGVKLLKELKPGDVKDSQWAYYYCYKVKDIPEVYENITNSRNVYWYCRYIKDRPEVYKNITDSEWAYYYCHYIENRPEVYKHIITSEWAYQYCCEIEDKQEMYKKITNPNVAYWYCRNIKDRPEVHKYIMEDKTLCTNDQVC